MNTLESFSTASLAKIIFFLLTSFISVAVLFFLPDLPFFLLFLLVSIFFGGIIFTTFLSPSIWVVLVFPISFFLLSQGAGFSGLLFAAGILVSLSAVFLFISLFSQKKNNIELQFFKTVSSSFSPAFIFFMAGFLLIMVSTQDIESQIKEGLSSSPAIESLVQKIIGEVGNSENMESATGGIADSLLNSFRPKIEAICQGNTECIAQKMKEIRAEIVAPENISDDQKKLITSSANKMVQAQLLQFLSPDFLHKKLKKYNVPFAEDFSALEWQKILIALFIFLVIAPFSFIFSYIFTGILSLLFLIFLSLKIFSIKTKSREQQLLS